MATKKKTGVPKKKAAPVKKKPSVESLAKTSDTLLKRNEELGSKANALNGRNSELAAIISGLNDRVTELQETVDDKNAAIKDMQDYITAYRERVENVSLEPVTVPAMANKTRVMAAIDELKRIRPELESWLNAITHFINLNI